MHDLIKRADDIVTQWLKLSVLLDEKKAVLYSSDLYKEVMELERQCKESQELKKQQEEAIKIQMVNAWLKEFVTLDGRKLLLKRTPWKCVITNELELDDKYKVTKTETVIDKNALLVDLRAEVPVLWASIEYDYTLLLK